MCGIAGIVGGGAESESVRLRAMRDIMTHRGPDDAGEYYGSGVALGHRRLAIIDLDHRGAQPMVSPDGRYALVYNGEVFNYRELREEIGARYPFVTQTDTEVVLAAWTLWGAACLDRFVGMFAFALWDRREKELFCARDRFGIKPFYYAEREGRFIFASEIKGLLAAGLQAGPNYGVIGDWLRWGVYDHAEETFFDEIYCLPPGHTLRRKGNRTIIDSWWDLRVEIDGGATYDSAAPLIRERLHDAVRLALRADVPLGVNVSGGFDSSLLLALIDGEVGAGGRLEGFSQDYRDERFSERPWIVEIARRTTRDITFSFNDPDTFMASRRAGLWYQDEPHAGVPVISYAGLYQATKNRGVTVLLDGNGVDEGFGGYRQYHNLYLSTLRDRPEFNGAIKAYATEWDVSEDVARSIAMAGFSDGPLPARDGSAAVKNDWLADTFVENHGRSFPAMPKPYVSPMKNAMYQDLRHLKVPRALRFNDRMSMGASRELRVPFLDHRLIELGMSLPDDLLFTTGRPKGLLRKMAQPLLPDAVRLAPKRSIQTPQSEWFAGPLREPIGDLLTSDCFRNRGIFDVRHVLTAFDEMGDRPLANSFSLWQVMHLEEWFAGKIDTPQSEKAPPFPPFLSERIAGAVTQ